MSATRSIEGLAAIDVRDMVGVSLIRGGCASVKLVGFRSDENLPWSHRGHGVFLME